jgi:hypothetical protein
MVARDLFIYILGHVTHYPTKLCANYGCVNLDPGQMVTGLHTLAERNGFSYQQVRSAMGYLISTNRVTRQSTKRYTIITVCNWDIYREAQIGEQPTKQPTEQPTGNQQATNRQPSGNHIQEVKKLRKDQNPIAVAIYNFYSENIINVPAKRSDAIRNITKLLNNGCTKEDLAGCVEDYLDKGVGDKPYHPNNFFGQKEYYKGYGKYAMGLLCGMK